MNEIAVMLVTLVSCSAGWMWGFHCGTDFQEGVSEARAKAWREREQDLVAQIDYLANTVEANDWDEALREFQREEEE